MKTVQHRLYRQRFAEGLDPRSGTTTWAKAWLGLLIAQDGSATRLCEAIAQGPVQLTVLAQHLIDEVPHEVARHLPHGRVMERFVSLSFEGEVMMDNLSYLALDALEAPLRDELVRGTAPIGHLFDRMWVRKTPLTGMHALHERLWAKTGLADPSAVRSYLVSTPAACNCMLISETFRAGMRRGLPTQAS